MSDRSPAEVFLPGDFIDEEIRARGWTEAQTIERLAWGVSRFYDVLDGRFPIVDRLARDLARVFGPSPDYWLNLQRMYDEWRRVATSGDDNLNKVTPTGGSHA